MELMQVIKELLEIQIQLQNVYKAITAIDKKKILPVSEKGG